MNARWIDEMLAMKENLSVVSESNMQDMLDHLSDEEKDILLRLYVNESRKGKWNGYTKVR